MKCDEVLLNQIREDYKMMAQSDWFCEAYNGKSLGDVIGQQESEGALRTCSCNPLQAHACRDSEGVVVEPTMKLFLTDGFCVYPGRSYRIIDLGLTRIQEEE